MVDREIYYPNQCMAETVTSETIIFNLYDQKSRVSLFVHALYF